MQLDLVATSKPMNGQLRRVYELMSDGGKRTLREIARDTGCLETSASARLRDLRKRGYRVERKRVAKGVWLYWIGGFK